MNKVFLYHCFPRRAKNSFEAGFNVLDSILRSGLLLTPEVRTIRGRDIVQVRMSFTAITPEEFPAHACQFGSFALEYDIPVMRSFGALPVFYLPGTYENHREALSSAGQVLIERMIEIREVLRKLNILDETGDNLSKPVLDHVKDGITELMQLFYTAEALLNLTYPTENPTYTQPLAYFHQKEWKLIPNFASGNQYDITEPKERVRELLDMDLDFFSRSLPSGRHMAEECRFYKACLGEDLVAKAERIIVPR